MGWTRVGMAKAVGERRENQWLRQGMKTISPEQGLEVLDHLIRHGSPQVGVMNVDWQVFFDQFAIKEEPPLLADIAGEIRLKMRAAPPAKEEDGLVRRLERAFPSERRGLLAEHIRSRISEVLALDSDFALDARKPLIELGLDSLVAVELRNHLTGSIGRPLPATLLFDCPTLDELTGYLLREILRLESPSATRSHAQTEDDELAELLGEIEHLPEDKVEATLAEHSADSRLMDET